MRQARLLISEDSPLGHYHCVSRVVDRRFIFDTIEKDSFARLLREVEAFCEVKVLTYCLMSNHFHVLVEVPKAPEVLPTAEQVLEKLERLSGHQNVGAVRQRFELYRSAKDATAEAEYLATFHKRMWDLSAFMKLLKQRFTQWYNGRNGRKGTLWEERFKSVLVEGIGQGLSAMAAYIDLNPVRAGLVKDPKDYRWSGYGEAVAGKKRARLGIQLVVQALLRGEEKTLSESMKIYRMHVFQTGTEEREAVGIDGKTKRKALKREEVLAVIKTKGRLPLSEYVTCRVRYFSDGAVFGSSEFVEGVFEENRKRFGAKRKNGARRMRGVKEELYSLRDLKVKVFG
jgi:putative transposase